MVPYTNGRRASKRTAVGANGILIREGLWVDAGDELQRIFVIDFLEYLVWELEAIDSPESVTLAVVLEVFVAGFQSTEIPLVFIHIVDVFSHQHAILIFHQEIMRRIGLASQLGEHCGDVYIHIWQGVEEFAEALQVIAVKREMRGNKVRPRVFGEEMVPLGH